MVLKKREIFIFLTCLGCVNITTAAVLTNRTIEQTFGEASVDSNDSKWNTSVCWSDDAAFKNNEIVPGAGPCEQCVCKAPSIVCSMIKCEVKTGCKIIQKANQCCPDYKCDCEYNGQTYDNGAKIETPDTPCRVCYCKGGDIMCTTVGCYEREDCEGKIVPGTCCPRYDHCPPLDPDNPKNRIKLTTANTVTLRNGKRGSQPWLLTTDSGHTLDAFSDLTTITNDEPDYTTETNPISDKMITMILKRFNDNDSTTWLPITLPSLTNGSNVLETTGINDFNTSTVPQNIAGESAVKEAINTVKVQSSTTVLNRTTSSLNDAVEARTELNPTSLVDEDDSSSSDNSSEESKETSTPSLTVSEIVSECDSSEESKEMSSSSSTASETSTENFDSTASIASAAGLTETMSVEYSTMTEPNSSTESVVSVGSDGRNTSKPLANDKLVAGTTLTIRTTVTQIENGTSNTPDDTEIAQVLFLERGPNLTYILSGSVTTNPESQITSNVTSANPMEGDTTTSSSGEYTSESDEFQIGLHTNLSLFVDASKLNSTQFFTDLSTITLAEATTVEEKDDDPYTTSTTPPTMQTNDDIESVEQNATVTNSTEPNDPDVEVLWKPISNITHENETSWLLVGSNVRIFNVNGNSSEIKNAVESREIESNTTEAFASSYVDQLGSAAANVANSTVCAPQQITNSSASSYNESNSSTTDTSERSDSTISSSNPVTTVESIATSRSTLLSVNSSESVSALEATSMEIPVNGTRIQNATVTTISIQPAVSTSIVITQSSTETSLSNDYLPTTPGSDITQNHRNVSFEPSTSSAQITTDSAQPLTSITSTVSTFATHNGTTPPTLNTTSRIIMNTTLSMNGTADQNGTHVQLMSQKYMIEPVKLINSVNPVYMSAGLGYREILRNHTENITIAVPPSTSSHENTSTFHVENAKTHSQSRSNSSVSAYKILLDGKVKPLIRPPNTTIAPLSWLKRPVLSKNSTASTPSKAAPTAANNTASTIPRSLPSSASTARTKTIGTTTSKSVSTASIARNNQTTTTARTISTVSDAINNKTTNNSTRTTAELTPATNSTASVNATAHESSSLKNESRQEPAQAKVYDPLMPYPEEYPEEYQTIQNGPAIIITRTTYTRIPDVTYTTVTMATLPTYARVQKAEENFASTLFDRKFGERSYDRANGEFGHGEELPASQSYFSIDVKKVDEKIDDEEKMAKNKRKMGQDDDDQKFVILQSQPISKEDEDVHVLDEKDMKIVKNFMNKNLKL